MPTVSSAAKKLDGMRVLVTRPQHQAAFFTRLIQEAGAEAVLLPTIDISYQTPGSMKAAEIENAKNSNLWIFTSTNSVIGAAKSGILGHVSTQPVIAAIGQATRQALIDHQLVVNLTPTANAGTEEFLSLFQNQFRKGQHITIFRGDSGRDELKRRLESLGAFVHYASVYQRRLPDISPANALNIFNTAKPCVITVTSDLGLTNLLTLIPVQSHQNLFTCKLVVNSERCAVSARKLGFDNQIAVATPPGDKGQFCALTILAKNL